MYVSEFNVEFQTKQSWLRRSLEIQYLLRVIRNTFRCRSSQKGSSYQVRITYWQRSSVLDIDTGKITHIYILARARKKVYSIIWIRASAGLGEEAFERESAVFGKYSIASPVRDRCWRSCPLKVLSCSSIGSVVESTRSCTHKYWSWRAGSVAVRV